MQAVQGRLAASRHALQNVEQALKTFQVASTHNTRTLPCRCVVTCLLVKTCTVKRTLTWQWVAGSLTGPLVSVLFALMQDGDEDTEMEEHGKEGRSSGRHRSQRRPMLVVSSESDEDDVPEEAPHLSGAKLDALEEELTAEEDRLQVSANLLGTHDAPFQHRACSRNC